MTAAVDPSLKRKAVIRELAGGGGDALLDIGSGPVAPGYPYADLAEEVVCVDHSLVMLEGAPENVTGIRGGLEEIRALDRRFDVVICADVFEHIPLEDEDGFVSACRDLVDSEGRLIVTVPHAGRFAWLDPYEIRPALHRVLHRLGLYRRHFNGTCDIRKGHKHYHPDELISAFDGFEPVETRHFGYLAEPLAALALSLERRGLPVPFRARLSRAVAAENARDDFGEDAYSLAVAFRPA